MGGQNHQPCNKPKTSYLRFSTMMSRELSVARASLESANVALEDVLLSELVDRVTTGTTDNIEMNLARSCRALADTKKVIILLRADMDKHEFEDLPTLQSTDLELLGSQLIAAGMVQNISWSIICDTMRRDGFYGMLSYFEQEIGELDLQTKALIDAINGAEKMAKVGQLNSVLEENQPTNFKVEFAKLYSSWHRFQQIFLASSMLSTELWYRYCDAGSLLEHRSEVRAA